MEEKHDEGRSDSLDNNKILNNPNGGISRGEVTGLTIDLSQGAKLQKPQGTHLEIAQRLEKAFKNYAAHQKSINDILPDKGFHIRIPRTQSLSLCLEVRALRQDPNKNFKDELIRVEFSYYNEHHHIDKPKFGSLSHFEMFFNRGPGSSEELLLEYFKDKPRGIGNKKISDEFKLKEIIAGYFRPEKLSYEQVAQLINLKVNKVVKEDGVDAAIALWKLPDTERIKSELLSKKFITAAAIKKCITNEDHNIYGELRNGKQAVRKKTTYVNRKRAKHALDRVTIDSTVFSFVHIDNAGKLSYGFNTCLVKDNYSGAIIGIAFSKYENAQLVIDAIYNSYQRTGSLPKEIFTDRYPGHNSEASDYFIKNLKTLNCDFEIEKTGNARAKEIESTIGVVCRKLKTYLAYLGGNITSSENNRVSVEYQRTLEKNPLTIDEVKNNIISGVVEYNSECETNQIESRIDRFNKCSKENAIKISLTDSVWLFYKREKRVIQNNLIRFIKNREPIYYEITDLQSRIKYNGSEVYVRYKEQDLISGEDISLWDIKTDSLIGFYSKQKEVQVSKVNMTSEDGYILNEIKKRNKEQREYTKQKISEVVPFAPNWSNWLNSSKAELLDKEELRFYLNTHDIKTTNKHFSVIEGESGELTMTGHSDLVDPFGKRKSIEVSKMLKNLDIDIKPATSENTEVSLIDHTIIDRLSLGMDDERNPYDEPTTIIEVTKNIDENKKS